MSYNSATHSFNLDASANEAGYAYQVFLPGESVVYNDSPMAPHIWGRAPQESYLFPVGDWVTVTGDSVGEFMGRFEDQAGQTLTDPIPFYVGQTYRVPGARYLRVIGTLTAGRVRLHYGSGDPIYPAPMASLARTNNILGRWRPADFVPYGPPSTDAGRAGQLLVSPVRLGCSGQMNGARRLKVGTYTTTHFDFLVYGYVSFGNTDNGAVTGGFYPREFFAQISGAAASYNNGQRIHSWYHPAVYYSLTASGVAASAVPPELEADILVQRGFASTDQWLFG